MTAVTLDRISTRARDIHVGRALLTAVAVTLWAVGWLAARTVTGLVAAALWSFTAVSLGWRDARPRREGEPAHPPRMRLVA